MSPRGKRLPPPKPVVRSGALGYTPLNTISASYLAAGYGDTVLGFRDPELRSDRPPALLQVKKDSHIRELSLTGANFNGYADALYRGRLPEVVLSFPALGALPDFLANFAEYLEQLLALGFLIPSSTLSQTSFNKEALRQTDPLATLVPCFVLAGSGMLFSRFITGLTHYLQDLKERYALSNDDALRACLIGHFIRCLPDEPSPNNDRPACVETLWEDTDCQARSLREMAGHPFVWREPVRRFRIAGGSRIMQRRAQSVMAAHGLTVSVESHAGNAVERLEFESAWRRLAAVVLPALAQQDGWSQDRLKQYAQRTQAGLMAIGRLRKAFGPSESLDTPVSDINEARGKHPAGRAGKIKSAASSATPTALIRPEDRTMLADLDQYALMLGLNEEQTLFRELADHLQTIH